MGVQNRGRDKVSSKPGSSASSIETCADMECSSAKGRKYTRKVEKDIRGWGRKSGTVLPKSP